MQSFITVSSRDLQGIQNLLSDIKKGAEKAVTLAINQTISTTKTQITKKLGEKLNLPASRIKQDIEPDKATTKKLQGSIIVKGEPVGLVNFAGAQLKTGVKVKVYKNGNATLLKHAFKQKIGNKEHLFWRKWKGQRKPLMRNFKYGVLPKKYRLPVKRLTGPRVPDVLAKPEILNPILQDAAALLVENTDKAVLEILRRNAL